MHIRKQHIAPHESGLAVRLSLIQTCVDVSAPALGNVTSRSLSVHTDNSVGSVPVTEIVRYSVTCFLMQSTLRSW